MIIVKKIKGDLSDLIIVDKRVMKTIIIAIIANIDKNVLKIGNCSTRRVTFPMLINVNRYNKILFNGVILQE